MEFPLLSPRIAWVSEECPIYIFARALEEVGLVIKWPDKCPLRCLLPGSCLPGLFRSGVFMLLLGHSWIHRNHSWGSKRECDTDQGSSCLQSRLHSAVISSFWDCVSFLRLYPGCWDGSILISDLRTCLGVLLSKVSEDRTHHLFSYLFPLAGGNASGRPGFTQALFSASFV